MSMNFNTFSKSIVLITCFISFSCQSQNSNNQLREVGGRCEGCEALYEYGDEKLNSVDTIPGFETFEPKLKITGTVYQKDGVTPAKNIVIYLYQTNPDGIYDNQGAKGKWLSRHGIHRGWVKTDDSGQYTFFTFRPGSYPNTITPQHIHLTVKEPNTIPYYIDDILFTDDPNLNDEHKSNFTKRGGNGIATPINRNGMIHIERNITLGLNIPNY